MLTVLTTPLDLLFPWGHCCHPQCPSPLSGGATWTPGHKHPYYHLACIFPWSAADPSISPLHEGLMVLFSTKLIFMLGFVDSNHYVVFSVQILLKQPAYGEGRLNITVFFLECRWAIPQTMWGKDTFHFWLRPGKGDCGEEILPRGQESEPRQVQKAQPEASWNILTLSSCATGDTFFPVIVLDT